MLRRIRTRCRLLAPAAALAVMLLFAWPTGLALCLQADGCLDVELVAPGARSAGGSNSAGCISDHCHAGEHHAEHTSDAAARGDNPATAGCLDFTVSHLPARVTSAAPSGGAAPIGYFAAPSQDGPAVPVGDTIPDPAGLLLPDASGPPANLLPALTTVRSTVRLC